MVQLRIINITRDLLLTFRYGREQLTELKYRYYSTIYTLLAILVVLRMGQPAPNAQFTLKNV